jgi:hypothetical protein
MYKLQSLYKCKSATHARKSAKLQQNLPIEYGSEKLATYSNNKHHNQYEG